MHGALRFRTWFVVAVALAAASFRDRVGARPAAEGRVSGRSVLRSFARAFALVTIALLLVPLLGRAAEITTGGIAGTVNDSAGAPLPGVAVIAVSLSGRYASTTNARGQYSFLGVVPDVYTIVAEKQGYDPAIARDVQVLVGERQRLTFTLTLRFRRIGQVSSTARAFRIGSTSDQFIVSGSAAQAERPVSTSAGLSTFNEGTVQGAVASAPGISFDGLGNVSTRGGKVDDTVFTFDSVPIPQGLTVDPGGNFVGAQTPTTGVGETSVTLAGYGNQSDNALGGIINQVPFVGTYPTKTNVELGIGALARFDSASFEYRTASPDLKSRFALSGRASSEYLAYGDGHTFYPGEASVVGIGLQARGQESLTLNYDYAATKGDTIGVLFFNGSAGYDQYGSPFTGETIGAFDGTDGNGTPVVLPGSANQDAPVTSPSRTRGFFNVMKLQWSHASDTSLERVQLYQSFFGARANGPFWDDNAFGEGAVSLASTNTGRLTGAQFDGTIAGGRHTLQYGFEHRIDTSVLDEIVPTNDEYVHSNPTLQTTLAYVGDAWRTSDRLSLGGTARFFTTHVIPSRGLRYDVAALDPHVGATYRLGNLFALRATFDHNTVAPKPLETDFTDSSNVGDDGRPAPFVPLTPERGNDFTYSFEGGGRTQFRLTYFAKYEHDRIDAIPPDLLAAVRNGLTPSAAGVPGNVGDLRAKGAEFSLRNGGFTFDANTVRAFSSSSQQFSFDGLNTAALLAGHLYPVSYLPDFTASASYEFKPANHVRVTPELTYETGYPYGVGKKIWIISPADNKTPILVNNDNNVDPGANYYFLRDPSMPFDAASNPYIANLGTPEGDDPYSLRSPPQIVANLHVEGDLGKRLTASLDVANLFGNFNPTQLVSNPYLIGPPGYKGGNATYAAYYGTAAGYATPYTLGNGVPTNDGVNAALPWTFGTGGYVGESWPAARTIQVRLKYHM